MPLYEYECSCGAKETTIKKVADRNNHTCKCGRKMTKLMSLPLKADIVTEPYFSETLNSWIKSPNHKKEVLRSKNLEPVG